MGIEIREEFGIFGEVIFFGEVEPVVEEAGHFYLCSLIGKHRPEVLIDFFGIVEMSLGGGFEVFGIGEGIPEGTGIMSGGGEVVGLTILVKIEAGVEEIWGGENEHEGAFHGGVEVVARFLENRIEVSFLLSCGEGASKSAEGEVGAEFLDFLATIRVVDFGAGEAVEVGMDLRGGFNRGFCDRILPSFGDR